MNQSELKRQIRQNLRILIRARSIMREIFTGYDKLYDEDRIMDACQRHDPWIFSDEAENLIMLLEEMENQDNVSHIDVMNVMMLMSPLNKRKYKTEPDKIGDSLSVNIIGDAFRTSYQTDPLGVFRDEVANCPTKDVAFAKEYL